MGESGVVEGEATKVMDEKVAVVAAAAAVAVEEAEEKEEEAAAEEVGVAAEEEEEGMESSLETERRCSELSLAKEEESRTAHAVVGEEEIYNQSIDQSSMLSLEESLIVINQSIHQSSCRWKKFVFNQSIKQPINQSIMPSLNENKFAINQPIN